MTNRTYRVTEVVGTSPEGIDAAIRNAVERASKTLRHIDWFEMTQVRGQVKDGAVVGVHMVGDRMGEQVGEAQLIYNWEALPAEVAQLIHAHPTQNEALGEAHLALAGKPLHAHD